MLNWAQTKKMIGMFLPVNTTQYIVLLLNEQSGLLILEGDRDFSVLRADKLLAVRPGDHTDDVGPDPEYDVVVLLSGTQCHACLAQPGIAALQ